MNILLRFFLPIILIFGLSAFEARGATGISEDKKFMFPDLLPYSIVLGSVICQADFSFEECEDFQTDLIELQEDLTDYLSVPVPREKVILCLFASWDSYRHFLGKKFPKAPKDRPALYVKDNGPGVLMVIHDDKMLLNIRHEMTHAILNAALKNVPIWIDEGLAKYFETPRGKRGFDNPFLNTVRRETTFWFQKAPSLPRLENLYLISEMGVREYRESWAWVHFMIHYSEKTQKILAYYLQTLRPENQIRLNAEQISSIRKSAPLTQLLESYLPNYKKQYLEHFRTWKSSENDRR